jgi:DNA-binding IscR family transcriptional regulator
MTTHQRGFYEQLGFQAAHQQQLMVFRPNESSTAGSTKEMDVIAGLWRDLHQKQRKILEGTTLADLMSRVSKPDDLMYVI